MCEAPGTLKPLILFRLKFNTCGEPRKPVCSDESPLSPWLKGAAHQRQWKMQTPALTSALPCLATRFGRGTILPGDDNKQFPAIPGARQPGRELQMTRAARCSRFEINAT